MNHDNLENFDMTLQECREVFDTIDNLVIVDNEGQIKYLSPQMYDNISIIEGRPLAEKVVGRHILDIHPMSKVCNPLVNGQEENACFYFTMGITNVARVKPVFRGKDIVGAIDYDLFSDDKLLKEFLDKILKYSEKGLINLRETVENLYEIGNNMDSIKYCVSDIIGESPAIVDLRKKIHTIAETESTIMIIGETGCGKELVAHSIHNLSRRRGKELIEINCAAIPENLFESELFGYEEGTFTGAKKGGRIGRFEMADKGTLFLDEIDQLPYHIQPKLLRALQEKEITRIGGKTIPVNIRVIAATNKNLKELVAEGKFRQDLYYRLNVIEVRVPPLRERSEDIAHLARHQITRLNKVMYRNITGISKDALNLLKEYQWPGNVRELFNILERASTVCEEEMLSSKHFGDFLLESVFSEEFEDFDLSDSPLEDVRNRAEKSAIAKVLKLTKGNRKKTAEMLKISRTSLYYKMEKYGLK